ncbi:agamatine deiminase [Rhodopirellula sp. MGV]|nr:agamatine deiminase [Rhodopirellula sp. MGV]PNY38865.1 agmatine deiminase family protein [Rhodopirellula baltica]
MTSPSLRVPAEWEPVQAIWLAWPHNPETWPGHFELIPQRFAAFVRAAAMFTNVRLIGAPELRDQARQAGVDFDELPQVRWVDIPTNDCWIRDYGPTFVFQPNGQHQAIDWGFNSWGGKYPPWNLDNAATALIIDHAASENGNWNRVEGGLCLEGGALEWDGSGRLLTTTECLITDTRNPTLTKDQAIERLQQRCGAREVVWLDGGALEGDDTDGHIDQLARFIDPSNIVVAVSSDPADPNHDGLEANYEQLCRWGTETSPNVTIHRLPTPPPRYIDGTRVPESYCNFLRVGPQALLIPEFGDKACDAQAAELLKSLAKQGTPDIQFATVNCREMIWGLGALHCASCNEPAVASA